MRGEHSHVILTARSSRGSSPHARGAHGVRHGVGPVAGIIPACAGSTVGCGPSPAPMGDHPRMRGEHSPRIGHHETHEGSSPHARGARALPSLVMPRARIIPACAGSTLEYPRLCPGLKRITLTLPITSEADKRTEKHPNHQLMPRAFRPSRRHCRAGCGPIHCLTPRTSWPSCTCLPCSSPFSSCRQASRHPCPSAS